MSAPLKLKIEIESICRKAGIEPGEVVELAVSAGDMSVTFCTEKARIEGGRMAQQITVPYVWEESTCIAATDS